jgi:UDP-2,3-diacylglucosamine pyrophosphatase LpxH
MSTFSRISQAYESALEVPFDDTSKIILMSDVHRGDGTWADDFSKNENIYFAALTHYYKENYTYIELGDGDELWENKRISEILPVHKDAFLLLARFFQEGRLYFIYGNHDMVKRQTQFVARHLYDYYDEQEKKRLPLFENIQVHEGLILRHKETGQKILLIHGHQASFMDSEMWRSRRFLVRHLWRNLEIFGFNDPTSTAKNYHKKDAIEKGLTAWAKREKQMLDRKSVV